MMREPADHEYEYSGLQRFCLKIILSLLFFFGARFRRYIGFVYERKLFRIYLPNAYIFDQLTYRWLGSKYLVVTSLEPLNILVELLR